MENLELEEVYDLELEKVIEIIKKFKAKKVVIQLPDGLKPYATQIAKKIQNSTGCNVLIWGGSCYGPCDIPELGELEIDLLFHFGHPKMEFKKLK